MKLRKHLAPLIVVAGSAGCSVTTLEPISSDTASVVGGGEDPPSPTRVRAVSSSRELTAALASAEPGDHIVLDGGRYEGTFVLDRAGTPDRPVVVRGRPSNDPYAARISGQLALRARYTMAFQLTAQMAIQDKAALLVEASNASVLRTKIEGDMRFSSSTGTDDGPAALEVGSGHDAVQIGWNEVRLTGQGRAANLNGITVRTSRELVRDVVIHGNRVLVSRDIPKTPRAGVRGAYIGTSERDGDYGIVVRGNWLSSAESPTAPARGRRGFYGKTGNVQWLGNVVRVTGVEAGLQVRNGDGQTLIGNHLYGCDLRIASRNHRLEDNVVEGGAIVLSDGDGVNSLFEQADNAVLRGNHGPVVLGRPGSRSQPVRHVTLEGHDGPIDRVHASDTAITTASPGNRPRVSAVAYEDTGVEAHGP